MQRRALLAAVAALAATAAGCSGGDGSTDQTDQTGPGENASAHQTATNDTEPADDGDSDPQQDPVEPDANDTNARDGTNDTASGEPERSTGEQASDPGESEIEILFHDSAPDDWGDIRVTGAIENVGDAETGYVEVVATFYDADGNTLTGRGGPHYAYANGVSPGEQLTFEIVTWIDYDVVAEYELDVWTSDV